MGNRLRAIENRPIKFDRSGTGVAPPGSQPGKWEIKEARKYNKDADGLTGDEPAASEPTPAPKKSLVQEVNGNGAAEADSSDEEEEDEDMADASAGAVASTNGTLSEKEQKKAEKAARKAARAEKRAKKEKKEEKKRKRESEGGEEKAEKKKKKKSK